MECNRRIFVRVITGVLLCPFAIACNRHSGELHSKEEKMPSGQTSEPSAVQKKSIPRVDITAPNRVETATFALG